MSLAHTLQTDVVVLGAGSAGCTVAGRLAEAGRNVVLVEAGPDFGPFGDPRWPAELVDARALATTHDWGYASGRWTFERARVIGGCSAHNGAIAAVGYHADYDAWGLEGWTAADVAPRYDRVLERMRVRTYDRSEAGPFHARCLDAAEGTGWRMAEDLCDLWANDSFGLESVNVDGTVRWNTAFAYLDPVRSSGYLTVCDHTMVDRVEAGRHPTVHARRRGERLTIEAATIVLAAGVYGTPCILQRSGIGDPDRLRAIGVEPEHELRGVGANLHDHPMVHAARAVTDVLQGWLDAAAATGFLPEEQTLGKAISSHAPDGIYDLHLFPVCASDQTSLLAGRIHVEVAAMVPRSRGRIDIVSPDPAAHPAIDHAYLADHDGHDLAVLRDGLAMAQELLAHPALASVLGAELDPTPDDEAIRDMVAHYYHPVGTAAMGVGDDAVCDARGRVRGLDGLVVADVSLLPQITRANTNLPAIMIGEAIADWV